MARMTAHVIGGARTHARTMPALALSWKFVVRSPASPRDAPRRAATSSQMDRTENSSSEVGCTGSTSVPFRSRNTAACPVLTPRSRTYTGGAHQHSACLPAALAAAATNPSGNRTADRRTFVALRVSRNLNAARLNCLHDLLSFRHGRNRPPFVGVEVENDERAAQARRPDCVESEFAMLKQCTQRLPSTFDAEVGVGDRDAPEAYRSERYGRVQRGSLRELGDS